MKHLFFILSLSFLSYGLKAQTSCMPPTYVFNGMTNVSGTGGIGSVYRFTNTISGVNVFVTITKVQNASITNSNMDITGSFAQAWQPTVRFTNSRNAGDSSYIEFSFKFVEAGSGATLNRIDNQASQQACLAMTIVDCDGPGSANSYREMVKVALPATPVGIKNSTINVTQDAKWISLVSGPTQFSNIDTTDYAAMAQINFPKNTSDFKIRVGAVGAVSSNLDRQFSFYFKSFTGLNFVLPVSLLQFNAIRLSNNDALLKWSTASEIDADYFEVYRSYDGINFEAVGQVKAKGNSHDLQNYQFTDLQACAVNTNDVYYSLKMVESSGVFDWSFISRLKLSAGALSDAISVYPNPASGILNLEMNQQLTEDVKIEVLDIYGKSLQLISQWEQISDHQLRLDISDLSNGFYLVRMTDKTSGESITKRFIKE